MKENHQKDDIGRLLGGGILVALVMALILAFWYVNISVATSGDHERVNDFAHRLEQAYVFTVQRADGKGPAVYTVPNPSTDFINIYGDYPPDEVKKIEAAARRVQSERDVRKKVRLSFYKKELVEGSLYHEVTIP